MDNAGDNGDYPESNLSRKLEKSDYQPKQVESDSTVDAMMSEEITSFLENFFKLYPTTTEKELTYYVCNQVLPVIHRDYVLVEQVNPVYTMTVGNVTVVSVKNLDQETKVTQLSHMN